MSYFKHYLLLCITTRLTDIESERERQSETERERERERGRETNVEEIIRNEPTLTKI